MAKKAIDRTGIRYGKLIAICRSNLIGRPKWLCKCDCGNEVTVDGRNLGTGNTVSCGCEWSRVVKKDMTGKRFGSLVVISEVKSKRNGFASYLCKCDCGKEIETLGMSLRNGDTVSCGCAYKIAGARRIKPVEHKKMVLRLLNKRRRASRLMAFRPFDKEFFSLFEQEAYLLCKARKAATGINFEIDHVIPLRSKLVCGLHNEFNLRVIPAVENNKKGNRYWPDMPGKEA